MKLNKFAKHILILMATLINAIFIIFSIIFSITSKNLLETLFMLGLVSFFIVNIIALVKWREFKDE